MDALQGLDELDVVGVVDGTDVDALSGEVRLFGAGEHDQFVLVVAVGNECLKHCAAETS